MTTPLRALIVEDREDDAELVLLELRRGGFDPDYLRVETPEAMSAALERTWDIVISDWSMPHFSAMKAFAVLREKGLDLPFIIVSGTIGEETAVTAMKIGVQDFMTKGQLFRLNPAIERELREAEIRRRSREMHEQLVISERMASVGTLAAGVAHEINNPLAAVIGNLEFVMDTLNQMTEEVHRQITRTSDEAARPEFLNWSAARLADASECAISMQEAAEQMRHVVRDLRVFSHPGDEKRQGAVNIRAVLESSLRMASNEIRHRARLHTEFAEDAPVEGGESRLGQIFLNLIVNAAQAIPEGRVARNEIGVSLRRAEAGDKVIVEIRDTGSGISPDVLPHIFDPFFTTKPSGEGTGLGLAICHRLVTALGGEIAVESEVGKGTKFRIALPVARCPEQSEETVLERPAAASRASILLVDDEPALRRTFQRMLKQDYDVNTVATAKEAVRLIAAGTRYDVILCDLMMPEMTGMDLHAELRQMAPDQAGKMAFVTGGAFTEGGRAFLEQVPNEVIEKPFTAAGIKQFVANLLR